MATHICVLVTLFFLNALPDAESVSTKQLPLWTWNCINDKCVPVKATMIEKLQSLTTCNMLCASMHLWPQPTGLVSLSTTAVPIRADLFRLQMLSFPSKSVLDHFRDAFALFQESLRRLENDVRAYEEWRSVTIRVTINENGSRDPRMRLDTDESYKLWVRPKNASGGVLLADISTNTFCGARHALETLSQLIWLDPYVGTLLILEAANVDDAPRFRYRGLMLDTARNYFPTKEIIRTIDAMSASKLNTFHWHATDSQAFSLQLNSVPQLAQYGAYGQGAMYTPDEIRAVARRARLRGIRVILEVDLPSHVGTAWDWGPLAGLNNLAYCIHSEPWSAYCNEPPCGQINPRNPNVYKLIEQIYSDLIQLSGVDDIFHIGGDDISERCWTENLNKSDVIDLWAEFTLKTLQRLESVTGKLPNLTILWSSHFTERIKVDLKTYVHKLGIQARNLAFTQKYITGVRTIISHEDAWDLNSGHGSWYEDSGGLSYNSWQRVYEHRPWGRKSIGCLEGGEATVWSSTLSAGGLDARIWPRAAAFAERLWSDRAEGATRPVQARLDVHRTRLVDRGIQAAPMWSMWCTHNTFNC